jgi:hypothetical protein
MIPISDAAAANLDVTKYFVPKLTVTNLRLKLFKLGERLREVKPCSATLADYLHQPMIAEPTTMNAPPVITAGVGVCLKKT